MKNTLLTLILLAGLVAAVGAVPNTGAATLVGNNNFTLTCAGAVGNTWFEYGTQENALNIWTQEKAPTGGVLTTTEYGSPIQPSTHYYYVACDGTGCDATAHSFDTTALVPIPTSTLGTAVQNMTESRFNLLYMPGNLVIPYQWLFPDDTKAMSITIIFGMIMMFIYIGLWLRTRSVATGVVMGLLTSSFILFTNQGLNLGIPVEFAAIAQGLLYASMAGVLLAFLKK